MRRAGLTRRNPVTRTPGTCRQGQMARAKKSSFRLRGRLNASRKSRLNYLTYLNSDGMPTQGRVAEPLFAGRIGGGGTVAGSVTISQRLKAPVSGGGAVTGQIRAVTRELAGSVSAGGLLSGMLFDDRVISGTVEGGGAMSAFIPYPTRVLAGAVAAGGGLIADLEITKLLGGAVGAGGALVGDMAEPIPPGLTISRLLMIGGGGSGGNGVTGQGGGGGGGAGQLIDRSTPLSLEPGTYPIVIGAGGVNANGGDTTFADLRAKGGGKGGNGGQNGANGGNGGGASSSTVARTGGTAEPGGFNGGNTGAATAWFGGAGGGAGAGAVGSPGAAAASNADGQGGVGGAGKTTDISGANQTFAGGGGGALGSRPGGTGGGGTGGNTNTGAGQAATADGSGGGGGGASNQAGGAGFRGRLVIRYAGPQRAFGGTITTVGTDTVHTFTANDNFIVVDQADADNLISAMTTAPTAARETNIRLTIGELKNAGIWSKLDALYMLAAANKQAAYLNWANPAVALTETGAGDFVADQGHRGSSTSVGALSAGLSSSAMSKYKQNDCSAFARAFSATASSADEIMLSLGVSNTPNLLVAALQATNNANMLVRGQSATAGITARVSAQNKVIAFSRTAASVIRYFSEGVMRLAGAQASTAIQAGTVLIAGQAFNASYLGVPRINRVALAGWGSSLTDAEQTALSACMENYIARL